MGKLELLGVKLKKKLIVTIVTVIFVFIALTLQTSKVSAFELEDSGKKDLIYSFEESKQGWVHQTYVDSQAITSVERTTEKSKFGDASLECNVDLIGGDENRSKGEAYVDLVSDPPSGLDAPVDLSNITVSVWLYLPENAAGDPSIPNGIQLFFKDDNWDSKYSSWQNIGVGLPTGQWTQLKLNTATEAWSYDGGCDLTRVRSIGVKIGAGGGSTATFGGSIYIDAFTWPQKNFQGVSYTSWTAEAYTTTDSDASLMNLRKTGANYVSLLVTQYMDDKNSTEIYADSAKTPTDKAVVEAIDDIHSKGMKVMLKPHIDVKSGAWRGNINPSDTEAWFSSYSKFINHYAGIAENHDVELFCAGTEFSSLVGDSYRPHWSEVISGIESIYTGSITYAANWSNYKTVSFWDLVDFAGIDAYFPPSNSKTPSVENLIKGWHEYNGNNWVSQIEIWQKEIGKPVIFTEIGYRSINYPAETPWAYQGGGTYNGKAQANCYRAAFEVFKDKAWQRGMFFWEWRPDPRPGGDGDSSYTPQNKPAENVLTEYYLGAEENVGPTDTTPPGLPSGVKIRCAGSGELIISWENPSDNDFSHVRVYRSTTKDNLGTLINGYATGSSTADNGLTDGETYYYALQSADISGNISDSTEQYSGVPAPNFNLAENKSVTASSNENHTEWYSGYPSYFNDGKLSTRWSSKYSSPQWIYVDLGSPRAFDQVLIYWEAAYGENYEIQISDGASEWTTVATVNNGDGGTDILTFPATEARYIRVYGEARGTQYGYSIKEFEVYLIGETPTADAGGPYEVDEGKGVELDGTSSSDPGDDSLSYAWIIKNDPTGEVSLADAETENPTLQAPSVESDTEIEVQLTVDDGHGNTDTDTAAVTVKNVPEEGSPWTTVAVLVIVIIVTLMVGIRLRQSGQLGSKDSE